MKPATLFLLFLLFPFPLLAADNLVGSPEALAHENAMVDLFGFERFEDDAAMEQAIRDGRLVRVPNNRYVKWHKNLPGKYAYVLPHVRDHLLEKGMAFHKNFGKPIIVTSAVRPKTYQAELTLRNQNAAPTTSTHPTGATVDIGYRGLRRKETVWLARTFSGMESNGEAQAIKEIKQPCFHVMIYPPRERFAAAETKPPL